MKYKVWILGVGETSWASNALEYDDVESAKSAAISLFNRWFGADKWAVLPINSDGQEYCGTNEPLEFVGFLSHDTVDQFAVERN